MASKIEVAALIMEHLVSCPNHGYAQDARYGSGMESITIDGQMYSFPGGDADCSSAVLRAYAAAGIETGGATYTGNTSRCLIATGKFERQPTSFIASRGDLYLNDSDHVAMCRQQSPDELMEFSQNEKGGISGGQVGDQTGRESRIGAYYDFPWDCIMHYIGDEAAAPNVQGGTTSKAGRRDGTTGSGIVYEVHSPAFGWLGQVSKVDDSEDGFAGWMDAPIDGIRAYREDGQSLTLQVYMSNGEWLDVTTFTGSMWGQNQSGDGYAGDINSGNFIVGIRCSGAAIRVAVGTEPYFGWLADSETPEGDDFAGEDLAKLLPITAVQMAA